MANKGPVLVVAPQPPPMLRQGSFSISQAKIDAALKRSSATSLVSSQTFPPSGVNLSPLAMDELRLLKASSKDVVDIQKALSKRSPENNIILMRYAQLMKEYPDIVNDLSQYAAANGWGNGGSEASPAQALRSVRRDESDRDIQDTTIDLEGLPQQPKTGLNAAFEQRVLDDQKFKEAQTQSSAKRVSDDRSDDRTEVVQLKVGSNGQLTPVSGSSSAEFAQQPPNAKSGDTKAQDLDPLNRVARPRDSKQSVKSNESKTAVKAADKDPRALRALKPNSLSGPNKGFDPTANQGLSRGEKLATWKRNTGVPDVSKTLPLKVLSR